MSTTASSVGSAKRKKNRSNSSNATNCKNKQSSGPLVPPPHRLLPSRKRARKMTTEFHKLLKEQEQQQKQQQPQEQDEKARSSCSSGTNTEEESTATGGRDERNTLQSVQEQIEKCRQDYQRASQVSTMFHSTSKWVLGVLAQNGWLYGRKIGSSSSSSSRNLTDNDCQATEAADTTAAATSATNEANNNKKKKKKKKKKEKPKRRPTRLLEIGAINTELLDAATVFDRNTTTPTHHHSSDNSDCHDDDMLRAGSTTAVAATLRHPPTKVQNQGGGGRDGRSLQVRAIDLHSMDPRIEEADFLALPILKDDSEEEQHNYFDVIVCSMVLNCGMTPQQRGDFLRKMHHLLHPTDGGLLFITLPRTCLQLSPYIDQAMFIQMLESVGLSVSSTRESPKIAFFVCAKQASRLLSPPPAIIVNNTSTTTNNSNSNNNNNKHVHGRSNSHSNGKWTKLSKIRRGKKYRNDFAVVLAPPLADG
jgi:25S rRNA (adenine(2142)-N(1))-methyltransferase, Bmt2